MAERPRRNPRYANRKHNRNDGDAEIENPPIPPPGIGQSQVDLMAIATIVVTTLQGLENTNPNLPPNGIKYHYEFLRKNRCPVFEGDADPEAGQSWIMNVETQLRLLEVPEALKADVVVVFLEDKASKWWETVSPAMAAAGAITWQQFKDAFLRQYYPAEVRLHKLSEFENLSQTPEM